MACIPSNGSDLADLARSLNRTRRFTPEQIRNRSGFLDSNDRPYIPLETIQGWFAAATSQPTPATQQGQPEQQQPQQCPSPVIAVVDSLGPDKATCRATLHTLSGQASDHVRTEMVHELEVLDGAT